jgi:hypothetical protein
MADINRETKNASPYGHTLPLDAYEGTSPLTAGLEVTYGDENERWVVVRVDDDDAVFHIRRLDEQQRLDEATA